eukprot:jgi/Psemu1/308790/fgenesh1_kg.445_\
MTMPKSSSLQQALSELPESERTLSKDSDSPRNSFSRTGSSNSMASSKSSKGRYVRSSSSNNISSSKSSRGNYNRSASSNSVSSSKSQKVLVSSRSSSSLQKEVGKMKASDFLERYEQQAEMRGKVRL